MQGHPFSFVLLFVNNPHHFDYSCRRSFWGSLIRTYQMALGGYFTRFLQLRDELSEDDLARLAAMPTRLETFEPGEVIVSPGPHTRSCLVVSGLAGRVTMLAGKPAVQAITALHVPGDFVDLHAFVLTELDHAVVAFGRVEVEFVDHTELAQMTEHFPHLTRLFWMTTAIDAAVHRQWLFASSVLRSSAHLAHLICELYVRMSSVGAARDCIMTVPLLQRELAEILGYSSIHINRAVRDLRDRKLVRWQGSEVEILSWDGLTRLARFDPTYLEIGYHPR